MKYTVHNLLMNTKDTSMHVFAYIIGQANMTTNRWYSVKENKEAIVEKMDIKLSTLDKHIKSLKERGFIKAVGGRGTYALNLEFIDIKFSNEK